MNKAKVAIRDFDTKDNKYILYVEIAVYDEQETRGFAPSLILTFPHIPDEVTEKKTIAIALIRQALHGIDLANLKLTEEEKNKLIPLLQLSTEDLTSSIEFAEKQGIDLLNIVEFVEPTQQFIDNWQELNEAIKAPNG